MTCHREHVEDQTLAMGLTMPADYCYHCHQATLQSRPSHANFAFNSCATAGCHNYHDNRVLYENFLVKHRGEDDVLADPFNLARPRPISGPSTQLTLEQADHPKKLSVPVEILNDWSATAHVIAGVNCRGCHATGDDATANSGKSDLNAWNDEVSHQVCQICHAFETEGFLAGRHGMRLAAGLGPMTPGEARLPMQPTAAHRELTCNACHSAHRFDSQFAAIEACLQCHQDPHSLAFKATKHYGLWQQESAGLAAANTGVSCATCHLPRVESGGKLLVDHNQNDFLRPNEKMVRAACMNCHGLQFSLDALASDELIENCFASTPQTHVESIEMAQAWFDQKEEQKRQIQAKR